MKKDFFFFLLFVCYEVTANSSTEKQNDTSSVSLGAEFGDSHQPKQLMFILMV